MYFAHHPAQTLVSTGFEFLRMVSIYDLSLVFVLSLVVLTDVCTQNIQYSLAQLFWYLVPSEKVHRHRPNE